VEAIASQKKSRLPQSLPAIKEKKPVSLGVL